VPRLHDHLFADDGNPRSSLSRTLLEFWGSSPATVLALAERRNKSAAPSGSITRPTPPTIAPAAAPHRVEYKAIGRMRAASRWTRLSSIPQSVPHSPTAAAPSAAPPTVQMGTASAVFTTVANRESAL
jgi:hypothetical protein